jgi:hypothetical protein
MSAKRKHNTIHTFLRYLKGELSNEERHALERDLEADAFEKEAMEGFEMISPADLEEDVLSLHSRMRRRQQRRRRVALYGIAATVASILVVGTIFINIYDFNPEADREAEQIEESLRMEKGPEAGEPAVAEEQDLDEEMIEEETGLMEKSQTEQSQVSGERDAKGRGAEKKLETPDDQEEALVPDLDLEMVAVEEAEGIMRDEADMAAPQLAKEEVPKMAGEKAAEMAPVPEADAVMAVEAAPSRRQKRALSTAKTVSSRSGQVSGVVLSAEDMDPLPGASVVLKGTDSGYVADMQGRFSVPAGETAQTTVVASYVGMVTEEYQLDPDQENRVVMQADLATLNEVVVVDYGAQTESHPVGAIQKAQVAQGENYAEYKGAEPDGGIEAYKMYMEKNIRFPAGDTLSKRAVVVLEFTVQPDGKLSGILTLRSPGTAFTEEAIRLLEEGPAWNPARDENGTSDEVVRMRIVFKL